jgi:hypothetical protein
VIAEGKVRALRDRLAEAGEVQFANGSVVRVVEVIEVQRDAGGKRRFPREDVRGAYDLALNGPKAKEQPSGDPAEYGDEAPWR